MHWQNILVLGMHVNLPAMRFQTFTRKKFSVKGEIHHHGNYDIFVLQNIYVVRPP